MIHLNYTLERFVNHPRALMMLSLIAKLNKTLSLPLLYYEKAIKLYPRYAQTYILYGTYLVDIGFTEQGLMQLRKGVEREPNQAYVYVALAKAYQKSGNTGLAREAADKARNLGYQGTILGDRERKTDNLHGTLTIVSRRCGRRPVGRP